MNEQDIAIPSVNTQILAGVIVLGAWMLSVNGKIRRINQNMGATYEALQFMNCNLVQLHQDSVTVKDVIRLAAASDKKGV